MSSAVLASQPSARRHFWRRVILPTLGTILGLILLVVIAVIAWFYFSARAALPQLDGTLRVAGLHGPVTVIRDAHGVPTIQADGIEDVFFAQGYVTAQDRLFQMDLLRRFAGGELAEVLGSRVLDFDREARILGMRRVADRAAQRVTGDAKVSSEAYARGINAFLDSHGDTLPIEFHVLRYAPRRWTVSDTFLIFAFMVKDLNHEEQPSALLREKILAKLGPELTADLFVNQSPRDQVPAEAAARIAAPVRDASGSDDADDNTGDDSPADQHKIRFTLPAQWRNSLPLPSHYHEPQRAGSNDWVVSGTHTVSGKPLLCNDMHLGHQMPGIWYEAHLKTSDGKFDVAGVTLPGTPGVVVGHNQRIAWGFTNVGPTVGDYYIETFNTNGEYQTPGGWQKPETREEVIHVQGAADEKVTVRVTRHGPIVTDLLAGDTRPIALRWTLYEPDSLRDVIVDVNRAQNWSEFTRAFSAWDAPGQNVVYADVDGHIGYHATGRIPIRASGDGSLPVSGADDAHEWVGWVPFDQLPTVFDPKGGIIATANGRLTPDKYPYSLSVEWSAPWRTARIYQVLESGQKFGPAEMLALQTDIYSEFDSLIAHRVSEAAATGSKISDRARAAADLLKNWDGRMSADSAAATIAYKARVELERLLLEAKLGASAQDDAHGRSRYGAKSGQLNANSYGWEMESIWLENVLNQQPARWLPARYKTYDELLIAALEAAVSGKDAPPDIATWRWGKFHPVDVEHPIFGQIPLLKSLAGPGQHEQSGSGFTVKAVGRGFGPSERFTADFSNWDHTTLNITTGESGQMFSPYMLDQWPLWLAGKTFELPFSAAAVEKNKVHQLMLMPAR